MKKLSENNDDILHDFLAGLVAVLVGDDLHVLPDPSWIQVQHRLRSQLKYVGFQFFRGSALDKHLVGCIYQLDPILQIGVVICKVYIVIPLAVEPACWKKVNCTCSKYWSTARYFE